MALQLPRGAEREYIATSGIVAVYVAALPAGPPMSASRAICCIPCAHCATDGPHCRSPQLAGCRLNPMRG